MPISILSISVYFPNKHIFRHLKLEIALSKIPGLDKHRKGTKHGKGIEKEGNIEKELI